MDLFRNHLYRVSCHVTAYLEHDKRTNGPYVVGYLDLGYAVEWHTLDDLGKFLREVVIMVDQHKSINLHSCTADEIVAGALTLLTALWDLS